MAVHARLRWMNGGRQDRALAGKLMAGLRREQGADGSWNGSVHQTIHNLFSLWLLQESLNGQAGKSRCTAKAVDWMLECGHGTGRGGMCGCDGVYEGLFFGIGRADREPLRKIAGVPFTPGCGGFVKTGAALFFATVFQQGDVERVQRAYQRLEQVGMHRHGQWCSWPCSNNILQAFAVHPEYGASKTMQKAIARLGECQTLKGDWGGNIPFYPTLFALSRVGGVKAKAQVGKALACAMGKQNRDGTWGRTQREAQTWMVLDAIERTA
jgi:hypothetical protein